MASQASIDRIKECLTGQNTVKSKDIIEDIPDTRQYKITLNCHNNDHEKCQGCSCECHKPKEVKKMPVSEKMLEPSEYSMDRKRAVLETHNIFVGISDEEVNKEFEKLSDEQQRNGNKVKKELDKLNQKIESKPTDYISSMKIPCSKCGIEKMAGQPRLGNLINKYGSIEKLKQEYKCKNCRE